MKYNDKNKPLVCMMTQSTCYKGTRKFTPKGVLWHSTGANNPWLKRYVQPDDKAANRAELLNLLGKNAYANDWNHIDHQAGLNFWIGKLADGTVAAVQTMPWDYRPWGCGSGSKGSCNNTHIQFEICEDGLNDKSYWEAVYKEACEMTAYLCKLFGINPKGTTVCNGVTVPTIIDHTGSHSYGLGSNHGDIQHWSRKYGVTMDTVRNDVAAILNNNSSAVIPTEGGLQKGDRGEAVKTMQTMLIVCGYSCGSTGADGDFGNNTLAGLKAFQAAAGLTVDGVYGEKTKAALEKAYANRSTTTSTIPASDPEKTIWDTLFAAIGNAYGTAGLMGNLYAESALNPQNLQNNGNKALGLTDAEFTAAFDSGKYSADTFIHDGYGYGLAQWTYYSRKEALLNYAKATGKSIGDLGMQLGFLLQEIKGYKAVWNTLINAKTVQEASDAVLTKYERPADQSEAVQVKRAGYGQKYFDKYASNSVPSTSQDKPEENKLTDRTIHDITKENLSQVPASRGSNKIEFIVVHYLGVPNADNPYLYGGGYGGHYNIKRDGSVYKAADPKTAVVWHCGGGLQGDGGHSFRGICTNYNSIGIECGVCYTDTSEKSPSADSDQWYFTMETQESLVWLVAKLMKEYGISIDHVIRHYDVTGKICPNPYVKNNKTRTSWTWDEFLARLKQQADGNSTVDHTGASVAPTTTKYYRVRKSWADKSSQIGAFTVYQNAKNCVDANPGYAAFDDNGKQVYPVAAFSPYLVRITITDLNYRKGPSTSYDSYGYIEPGVYTIVDEKDGWGLLKAYAAERNGWVKLSYTTKL